MADRLAAVGERAVGGHQVDRPDLLDAQREGQLRLPLALELHPELLGLGVDVVGPLMAIVLTAGMLSENWSALRTRTGPRSRLSASLGRIAATEVGADVHQHRARGDRLVVDADRVVERLERRTGLAIALADDVVLRLEVVLVRRAVVVARCRRRRRARRSGSRARPARRCGGPCSCRLAIHGSSFLNPSALAAAVMVLRVRDDRRGRDPLLGDLLEVDVEGRGDPQAAVFESVARRRRRRTACWRARHARPTRSAARSSAASPGWRARPARPRRP